MKEYVRVVFQNEREKEETHECVKERLLVRHRE